MVEVVRPRSINSLTCPLLSVAYRLFRIDQICQIARWAGRCICGAIGRSSDIWTRSYWQRARSCMASKL
jgi:hypothetical protein